MLLLDSQALLWTLAKVSRLGPRTRAELTSGVPVHVSAATILELTIKAMLGRLQAPAGLTERITQQGFDLLSVTPEHAEGIRQFPELARHDPFNRLLVAQASLAGMRLVTADGVLLKLGYEFIVDATV